MKTFEVGLQLGGTTGPLIKRSHVTVYKNQALQAFVDEQEKFPLCAEFVPGEGRAFNALIKITGVYRPERLQANFSGREEFQFIGMVCEDSDAPGVSVRVVFPKKGSNTFEVSFSNDTTGYIPFA